MKNFVPILLLLIITTSISAQQNGDLEVKVQGIPSENGQIRAALFDSPEGFPDDVEQSREQKSAMVTGDSATLTFQDLPFGEYVLAVFHDKNNNGVLDKTDRGIPLEALGVSQNLKMKLGPPKYDRAVFEINELKSEIHIDLKAFKSADVE